MSREFPLAALRTADGGTNAAFEFAFASLSPGLVPGDYIADSKYGIEKGIGLFMVLFGDKGNPAGNWVPFVFVLCAFRLTPLFSHLSGFLPWSFMPHVHSGFPGSFLRRNTCHLVSLPNASRQQPHSLR